MAIRILAQNWRGACTCDSAQRLTGSDQFGTSSHYSTKQGSVIRADFVEAHARVKDFEYDVSYEVAPDRYPTDSQIPAMTSDLSAICCATTAVWNVTSLKMVLPMTTYYAEYSAMKCTDQVVDAVTNAELQQGYLAQMIDEVRHVNQEAHLMRYLTKHSRAPECFDRGFKLRSSNLITRASRAAFEQLIRRVCQSTINVIIQEFRL